MGDANDTRAASQHGSGGLSDLNKLASGPKYSGARGDHRTWWFKAQSYLGTKDLGTLAKGERQEEANSDDQAVKDQHAKDNSKLFDHIVQMIDSTPETEGESLISLIMDDYVNDETGEINKDGYALGVYLQGRARLLTTGECETAGTATHRRSRRRSRPCSRR